MATDFTDPPLPEAAIRYLGSRGLKPSGHWTDVWREEHALAFTAARMGQNDLLVATHRALITARAEGMTQKAFVASLGPRLVEMGWAPPPTGGDVPTRLARIYDTNMRTANAAGQWDRIQRVKDAMPFLLYQPGPSLVHREDHRQWWGLILPVDDEFWTWAYPPNGFGCKCHVRQITEAEADRLEKDGIEYKQQRTIGADGKTITYEDRTVTVTRERPARRRAEWTNPATGEVMRITEGIDPSFDYNPGRHRPEGVRAALGRHVRGLVDALCPGEATP